MSILVSPLNTLSTESVPLSYHSFFSLDKTRSLLKDIYHESATQEDEVELLSGSVITKEGAFTFIDYFLYLVRVADSIKCVGDGGHHTSGKIGEWTLVGLLSVLGLVNYTYSSFLSLLKS